MTISKVLYPLLDPRNTVMENLRKRYRGPTEGSFGETVTHYYRTALSRQEKNSRKTKAFIVVQAVEEKRRGREKTRQDKTQQGCQGY